MIVLNELFVEAESRELTKIPRLEEEATMVPEHVGFDEEYLWQFGRGDPHGRRSYWDEANARDRRIN